MFVPFLGINLARYLDVDRPETFLAIDEYLLLFMGGGMDGGSLHAALVYEDRIQA